MKQRLGLAIAAALTVLSAASIGFAANTAYEVEYTDEKPLMIIRFNEQHLHFERQLYDVVSRALEAKPSVVFDIVSIAPRAQDSDKQERYNQISSQNTQKVLATLTSMGLPGNRINLTKAEDNVTASEVRIFVR